MEIMIFENYTHVDRLNDILDKISKYGVDSLTENERRFLDSFSTGGELFVHKDIEFGDIDKVYEDDIFKFEMESIEVSNDCIYIIGTMYVPSLESNKKRIVGVLDGVMVVYPDGYITLNFIHEDGHDIFDFCGGLEYELDSFVDYVVDDIIQYLDK